MSNLPIKNKDAIEKLQDSLKPYALAKNSNIIYSMVEKEALIELYKIIAKICIDSGLRDIAKQEDVIINISQSLLSLIKDKYRTLTIDELRLACSNGMLGEYGTYFGINLKTISDWIKSFLNSETRKKAMAEWNNLLNYVQINKYSDEQKEQIIIDGCLHEYNEFKAKSLFEPVISFVFYDYLKKIGLINFNREEKIKIAEDAESEYKKYLLKARNNRQISTDLMNTILATMDTNKTYANICKKIALRLFFTEIQSKNLDLKKIIDEQVEKNKNT